MLSPPLVGRRVGRASVRVLAVAAACSPRIATACKAPCGYGSSARADAQRRAPKTCTVVSYPDTLTWELISVVLREDLNQPQNLHTQHQRDKSQEPRIYFSLPNFGRSAQEHEHKGNENKSAKYGLTTIKDQIKLQLRPCAGKLLTENQTVRELIKGGVPWLPYHG